MEVHAVASGAPEQKQMAGEQLHALMQRYEVRRS
jgi:hypothetical protein